MVTVSPEFADLPIERALPALRRALSESPCVVLQAPPGAGKTTRVPLALLGESWLGHARILMLEPRRLAARAAARRMAASRGELVGATVGFRVRGETRVGSSTRIEVVTEGVLTRLLLRDPTLDGTGLVVFDEFHERSLHADLGLALTLRTQELLRPDLRVLIMSATLESSAVARLLGDCPVVTSDARSYPIEVRYAPDRHPRSVEQAVATAVHVALREADGGVLAFLPGAGEIRRCMTSLGQQQLPPDVTLLPLYGDLPAHAQDLAIAPAPSGVRKVVLATSIAETSLTIEGVRVVVDCGYARVPRFSPRTGMSRLETVRVSRAAANQRCGRAGRTAPGVCYRLWSAEENAQLLEYTTPEIREADLASFALDLAAAGVGEPSELRWLDPPPSASLAHGRELLRELGALDALHRITPHGVHVSAFGLHPRLAHMLLAAKSGGTGASGCVIAALVEERDILRRDAVLRDADVRTRVAIVAGGERERISKVDRDGLRRVERHRQALVRLLGVSRSEVVDVDATGRLLALAYPDRVAQRRAGGHFLLRNGTGAELVDEGGLATAEYLAIAELDGRVPRARIFLAAPLSAEDLHELFGPDIEREHLVRWSAQDGSVVAVQRDRLGAIVLHECSLHNVDADLVVDTLIDALVRGDGLALTWGESATAIRSRIVFARAIDSSLPDVRESAILANANTWLRPHLVGARRRADVERLPLADILAAQLSWEQRRALEQLAPTHIVVPSGSRIPVDYTDPAMPVLSVRVQEMFGLAETPTVGGGRIPLTLHLLSPARRPVQVTRDLRGFWQSSYYAVRAELRGRYPKHEWPDDPMQATPTRRAKPRRT